MGKCTTANFDTGFISANLTKFLVEKIPSGIIISKNLQGRCSFPKLMIQTSEIAHTKKNGTSVITKILCRNQRRGKKTKA